MNNGIIKLIICVLFIVFIILLIINYNYNGTNVSIENIDNSENNLVQDDIITDNSNDNENVLSTENNIDNTISDNTQNSNSIQNAIVQDNLISSPEKNIYESEKDVGSTSKKQEAINLVKEYWGEDDTVNFTCDSVTSNGEYIIAVISKKTAAVSGYFRVNIDKKSVEVDY